MTSISFKPSIILIIIKKEDLHWNYENGALAITLATLVPRPPPSFAFSCQIHFIRFLSFSVKSLFSPLQFFLRFIMCHYYGQQIVLLFQIMLERSCACIAFSSVILNCLLIQNQKNNNFPSIITILTCTATWYLPSYYPIASLLFLSDRHWTHDISKWHAYFDM